MTDICNYQEALILIQALLHSKFYPLIPMSYEATQSMFTSLLTFFSNPQRQSYVYTKLCSVGKFANHTFYVLIQITDSKKQRHYFANKGLSSQSYGFSSSHVWM